MSYTLRDEELFLKQLSFIFSCMFTTFMAKSQGIHNEWRCYYDKYQRSGSAFTNGTSDETIRDLIESQETINLMAMDCEFGKRTPKLELTRFIPREFEAFKEAILKDQQLVDVHGENYLNDINVKNALSPGNR